MSSYEIFLLIFILVRISFFNFFILVYVKWLIVNIVQRTLKISIEIIIKNLEMLRFVQSPY